MRSIRRVLIVALACFVPSTASAQVAAPSQGSGRAPAPAATPAPAAPGAPGAPAPVAPAPAATPTGGVGVGETQGLPTVDALRQQLAAGQQQEVLRQVQRLLALKGPAAQQYDRYELFMLRGEAALRNKAMPMAADAFKAAQKETTDADKQSIARATELLVRRSKQTGYVPKTAPRPAVAPVEPPPGAAAQPAAAAQPPAVGQPAPGTVPPAPGTVPPAPATVPPAPGTVAPAPLAAQPAASAQPASAKGATGSIPIVEEAGRKQAFAALLNDELVTAGPKVKAATNATGLPPVIEAARLLGDLRALELASGAGGGGRVKQMGTELAAQAHKLIASAMNGMDKRVEDVWNSASRTQARVDRSGYRERQYGMFGMNSTEANDLKGIIATCEKVIPVANDLAAVTGGSELAADAREAQRLYDRAREVLQFDYANEGRNTSQSQTQPQSQTQTRTQPRQPIIVGPGATDVQRGTGGTTDISRP
jgi:hypothetical protein